MFRLILADAPARHEQTGMRSEQAGVGCAASVVYLRRLMDSGIFHEELSSDNLTGLSAIRYHQPGIGPLSRKDLALLTLQSLVFLPFLVFMTKGTVVVLAIVVVSGLVHVHSRPGFGPMKIWVSLVLLGALSAVWSITPEQSIERAGKLGLFLFLLAALIHIVSRWSVDERRFIAELGAKAWWLAIAIVMPSVFFESDLKSLFSPQFPSEQESYELHAWKLISNNAVVLLVITFFPVLGRDLSTRRHKVCFLIAIGALMAASLESGSTSALFGLIIGLFVWWIYSRFPRAMFRVLSVGLPLTVLAMPILIYPMAKNPEFIARSIPHFPNSFIHRLLIWDFTLERISERPLLGWGLDTSRAIPRGTDLRPIHYVVPWSDKPITHPDQNLPLHPHNAVLQIWLELGFLGVVAFMFAIHALVRSQLGDRGGGPMAGFVVGAMAIYCVAFGLMQSWWLAFLFLVWATAKAAPPTDAAAQLKR